MCYKGKPPTESAGSLGIRNVFGVVCRDLCCRPERGRGFGLMVIKCFGDEGRRSIGGGRVRGWERVHTV